MEPPAKPLDYLPTPGAKWSLWLSIILSALPYALPQSLLIDMRFSEDTLLWFLRLLMSAAVLLAGAYITLFLIVRYFRQYGVLINISLNRETDDLGERLRRANERTKNE